MLPEARAARLRQAGGSVLRKVGGVFGLDQVRSLERLRRPNTVDKLHERAVEQSAAFIEPHLASASLFSSSVALHEWCARRFPQLPKGHYLEFGFFQGQSAHVFANGLERLEEKQKLVCFDSFSGLRDGWSQVDLPAGSFDQGGIAPEGWAQVEFVVGWVEETLPVFLSRSPGAVVFVHLDLDVYEPTREVLRLIRPRFVTGSLLLFDELHGYPGFQHYELRALNESLGPDEYEFVAFGPEQALIRLL